LFRKDEKGNDILRLFPLVRFEGEQFSVSSKEVPLSVPKLKGMATSKERPVENEQEGRDRRKSGTGQTPPRRGTIATQSIGASLLAALHGARLKNEAGGRKQTMDPF
jgi:hypothetical protein